VLCCTASRSRSGCSGAGDSQEHPGSNANSEATKPQRSKFHASELRSLALKKQIVMECHGPMAPSLL
jgi:hypothetical protein